MQKVDTVLILRQTGSSRDCVPFEKKTLFKYNIAVFKITPQKINKLFQKILLVLLEFFECSREAENFDEFQVKNILQGVIEVLRGGIHHPLVLQQHPSIKVTELITDGCKMSRLEPLLHFSTAPRNGRAELSHWKVAVHRRR